MAFTTSLDYMDDDGLTEEPVPIAVSITIAGDTMTIDFTGTSAQRPGCINAPQAVTVSASLYMVRCIVGEGAPANQGCLRPVTVITPRGTLVNPEPQRGVAGGNVETSQRITDVLLTAMAQALPELIPAASQGTMNNLLIGGHDLDRERPFVYYETIGGGMGARPTKDGISGIHTHMTNTMNTPIEALEFAFPSKAETVRAEARLRRRRHAQGRRRTGEGRGVPQSRPGLPFSRKGESFTRRGFMADTTARPARTCCSRAATRKSTWPERRRWTWSRATFSAYAPPAGAAGARPTRTGIEAVSNEQRIDVKCPGLTVFPASDPTLKRNPRHAG